MHTEEFIHLALDPDIPASHKTILKPITWNPPIAPYIKVNTDGSIVPNSGRGGIGGIFRTTEGRWILGFTGFIKHASNMHVQLLAIRTTLWLAVEKNFTNIILESDSLVALQLLDSNNNDKLAHLVFFIVDL